ncbi:MAG: SDR family NAD(P)-dependent oxidoreductase [Syntrophales bacterium]|nr:SDR family NAD(P)-dependent oxidoreductase [Syntrophales bacterium]
MDLRIKGKTAIVTGGGSGIGRAICLRLAAEGATVIVSDLVGAAAERVAAEITDRGGAAMAIPADATKEDDIARLVQAVLESYGMIDILVNNVGGGGGLALLVNMAPEVWDKTIDITLKSAFLCSKAVAPDMMKRKQGRIINIASIAGKSGEALLGAYCAAKFGVVGLTQVLAKELGRYSITVNAVCPGYVYTQTWEQLALWMRDSFPSHAGKTPEEIFEQRVKPITPLGRPQTAEDMASLVAYLASEDARNITGQAINVDGGAVMH